MKQVKILFQVFLYAFLYILVNFGTLCLFTLGYNIFNKSIVNDPNYTNYLGNFINNNKIFIVLLSGLIVLPIIYKNIKKYQIKFKKINIVTLASIINIAVVTCLLLNIIILDTGINNVNLDNNRITLLSIISTTILGPIIEELIFRGIIYNKLKKDFNKYISVLLVSIIFGIFHLNIIQGLYAFIFSVVITYTYEKTDNLLVPILVHCIGNLAVVLLFPFVLDLPIMYVQLVLIVLIVLEIINIKLFNTMLNSHS